MSISIYYQARRKSPLSQAEAEHVAAIAEKFSVDSKIEELLRTGGGLNWESFDSRTNVSPGGLFKRGVVFAGATKLPDNTENATWEGVQHWCACLSEIRCALPQCDWHVTVEDHIIQWCSSTSSYNPAS